MTNPALKRARKAQRRKQVVAQKRKIALIEASVGRIAVRAAQTPLRRCLMHGEPFDGGGMASIIVARGASPYRLTLAIFLVDVFCLGIKDVILEESGAEEFATVTAAMEEVGTLSAIEPAYARKLLQRAAAWARSIGFGPHRDFVAVEQIFGDVDATACEMEFEFGKDDKPFYIVGDTETPMQVRQRLAHLVERFGKDGFEYMLPIE